LFSVAPIIEGDNEAGFQEVILERPLAQSFLCTLTLESNNDNNTLVVLPVARSYNGHPWERAGGGFYQQYHHPSEEAAEPDCNATACTLRLPVTDGSEMVYNLQTRAAAITESPEQQQARFYEEATFGVTQKLLLDPLAPGTFVLDQISQPATSHRALYRRHMNPIWEFHKPEFAASLNPCSANSDPQHSTHWRRNILTVKDLDKELSVEKYINGGNDENSWLWKLSIDGQVRAIVPQLRFENESFEVEDGKSYLLCGSNELYHRGYYRMQNKMGKCQTLVAEDLFIDFPDSYQPELVLKGDALPPLTDDLSWQQLPPGRLPEYRPKTNFLDPTIHCKELPPEYQHDGPPIFAKTVDGTWLQFTPRIRMQDNTIAAPLPDGGAEQWMSKHTRYCSNVVRSFINEEGCTMSTEKDACSAGNSLKDSVVEAAAVASAGVVVCGSPYEISNDPSLGDGWMDVHSLGKNQAREFGLPKDTTIMADFERQREFVWNTVALTAKDQLRQRMAWALFQIFSMAKIAVEGERLLTEAFVTYYDIFVRHAFGNYYDILREIAASPIMAENLSFIGSRSVGVLFLNEGSVQHADENFARELMQLFTIGLLELNQDGTLVVDSLTGKPIQTYDSKAIRSMARVWTGYTQQPRRANVENLAYSDRNRIDPLTLLPYWRDRFPKSNLNGGYIGDGYPLCENLPEKAFLKLGAKYRLLGTSPKPELLVENPVWSSLPDLKRLQLEEGASGLHEVLCSVKNGGSCTFPAVVKLEKNLECPTALNAPECIVDTVSVVQIEDVFYEYIRQPCVEFAFYNDALSVTHSKPWRLPTCANSKLPVAGAACCNKGEKTAEPSCVFAGERVTLNTAEKRCAALDMEVCSFSKLEASETCPHVSETFNWRTDSCWIKAKVNAAGEVAIFHDSPLGSPENLVKNDTVSFFDVVWESKTNVFATGEGAYPSIENNCGGGICEQADTMCFCNTTVSDTRVFSEPPIEGAEIFEKLKIGFPDPAMFSNDMYMAQKQNDYVYHSSGGTCCDSETVFEVVHPTAGTHIFLLNLESSVTILGTDFSFRNPLQFNSILMPEYTRATAEDEAEALLQHLFYHPNTAPFLATRFIQRFGISSPSPRYVKAVSKGVSLLLTCPGGLCVCLLNSF